MDQIKLVDIIASLPSLIVKAPRASKALPILNRSNKFLSLGKILEQTAQEHPNNVFIRFEGITITYKAFNDYSNKFANYLIMQGIQKGDVVSLLFDNRPEFLIAAVAVVKTGAIASLLNPSQRGQVLLHSINLVKTKAILVGEELIPIFNEVRKETKIGNNYCYFVADQDLRNDFKICPEDFTDIAKEANSVSHKVPKQLDQVHRFDSCFYIYTSGTTGMPKASVTNHERWISAYAGLGHALVQLNEKDVFYCALPFYHATAMLVCWGSIIAGASSLVLKRKFSVSEFWRDVKTHQVTAFGYVGELCRYLLNQEPSPEDKNHNIRLVLGNGLRPSAWKAFKQRFGIKRVIEFYAASEGNVGFINLFNLDNTIGLGSHNLAVVKYAKEEDLPIRNDKGFMIKVDKHEAGLLLGKISSVTPFPGYTDKNQTQKAIFNNVFEEGDEWFNTGDMVRNIGWRHYQFVDRLGDTFRWKGENVSTTELENICMQFPGVEDCTAYGVEIPETNGRAGMVCISTQEQNLNLDDLLAYFKSNLPAYAIPRFIRFKSILETTGTFKHKKSELKEDAFQINRTSDPLYVMLPPDNSSYLQLTHSIHDSIMNGDYPF